MDGIIYYVSINENKLVGNMAKKKKNFTSTLKFDFRQLLLDKKMSIKDFAATLDLNYGTVQKMVLSGQALPKRIRLISNIFGLKQKETEKYYIGKE